MKQRFAVTLLAVAIASLSASAFAVAPVISDFRSPVISDDTPATNSNDFVYPDADDLNNHGHDPDGTVTDANIIWSFLESSGTYAINNRATMNLGTDNPNAPAAKGVGATGLDDVESVDANVRTITYRNIALSPWSGPGAPPSGTFPNSVANGGAGAAAILTAQTKVITMFASDGSTYTSKSFTAYTQNGSLADRLSGGLTPSIITATTVPVVGGATGWTSSVLVGTPNFSSTNGTNGLCVNVPLGTSARTDANFATWTSPYGIIQLTKNKVYRVRLTVLGNPAINPSVTPLWDFVIDNVNPTPSLDEEKYGMDVINWDNNNSHTNAAGPLAGKHTFDIWWAPMALEAADWNDPTTGEFTAAHDPSNDARFLYRILDAPGTIDAGNDAGTLCMKDYQIISVDKTALQTVGAPVYNQQAPVAQLVGGPTVSGSNTNVSTLFGPSGAGAGLGGTTVTNGSGVTIKPLTTGTGGSWGLEIIALYPGDVTLDLTNVATIPDNYPITWVDNQLLRITAGAQAPDATGESNPPDVLRMTMDAPTSELSTDLTFSGGANLLGMPKLATMTTYTGFFFTSAASGTVTTQYKALRPSFGMLFQPAILTGGLSVNNGGITVKFLKVDQIDTTGVN